MESKIEAWLANTVIETITEDSYAIIHRLILRRMLECTGRLHAMLLYIDSLVGDICYAYITGRTHCSKKIDLLLTEFNNHDRLELFQRFPRIYKAFASAENMLLERLWGIVSEFNLDVDSPVTMVPLTCHHYAPLSRATEEEIRKRWGL